MELITFSLFWGFGGSFISLLISKQVAKWSTGAKVINGKEGGTESWLITTVRELSEKAGIGMPEVAIYEGGANAFATGAFKNNALVAVSTGLISSMERDEIKAVLAHEIGHVANGDMVTMALIQGVVNSFVLAIALIVGFFVDRAIQVMLKNEEGEDDGKDGLGVGYYVTVF